MQFEPVPTRPRGARTRLSAVVVALAPVAALVGVVVLAWPGDQQGQEPAPTTRHIQVAPATPPPPFAVRDAAAFPAHAVGLPVLTIDAALQLRREGALTDEVVAVAGYLTMDPRRRHCPAEAAGPTGTFCRRSGILATRDTPVLRTGRDGSDAAIWIGSPGPHLHPQVLPGTALPARFTATTEESGYGRDLDPVPVVVLGRFDDQRAERCSTGGRFHCGEEFVLERVTWVNGRWRATVLARDPSIPRGEVLTQSRTAIAIAERERDRGEVIVGEVVVPADRLALVDAEAAAAVAGRAEGLVWYLRSLAPTSRFVIRWSLTWAVVDHASGTVIATGRVGHETEG